MSNVFDRATPEEMMRLARKDKEHRQLQKSAEWYSGRSLMGYSWAMFYFMLGGREAGKSYYVTNFFVRQWKRYKRPFIWLRLTDGSAKKLLQNNAEKLIDADIRRKWDLDLWTNGSNVYEVKRNEKGKIIEKKLMARVLPLNTFYNDKGNALFDNEFLNDPNMYYNICLDEMNREKNEKNTFDIVYAFANQIENLIRSTKERVRIICIGNTLEEASDILATFNFLPQKFGVYKLKKKKAVIDYIAPTEKYKARRTGTAADILSGDSSTFTNEIPLDTSRVCKWRLRQPQMIIKFSKDKKDWFTVWNDNIVAQYKGEKLKLVIAMRPYLDEMYDVRARDQVFAIYNARAYMYHNLITQSLFKKQLELLKKT